MGRITRGRGSRAAGLAMAFKLIEAAQDHWAVREQINTTREISENLSY